MNVVSPSELARTLALRLREDDSDVRLALHDIVTTLGSSRADALANEALAVEAAGGMIRPREGIRVRLTPSGVFLTLAREAGWKGGTDFPTTRLVPPSPAPLASVERAPSRPASDELPHAQLHVTIKSKVPPALIAAAPPEGRLYALRSSGRVISFTLQPSAYKRFETLGDPAAESMVLVITGKIGRPTGEGFELDEPAVQVLPPGGRPFASAR